MSPDTIDNLGMQYAAERAVYPFPEPYYLAECLWAVVERPITPDEVVALVSEMTGVAPRDIRRGSRVRREAQARDVVAWLLVRRLGYSINEAGAFLGVPHSVVHRGGVRVESHICQTSAPNSPGRSTRCSLPMTNVAF